jgi:MFS family permease
MIRRAAATSDLPHLVAFALIHAAAAAVRPTVSYRALELGAGAGAIGVIGGAFAVLSLLAAIPVGARIDRKGERLYFMVGAATVLAATLLNAVAGSVVLLIVTQSLLGFGHMATGLAIQTVTAAGPVHLRDNRFARMSVAASAGQFLGPLAAGAMLEREEGFAGLDAIPAVFLLSAVVTVVAAGIAWKAPAWSRGSATGKAGGRSLTQALGMVRIPGMMPALATSVAVITTFDILVAYLPVLGEENGISPAFIGLVLSIRAAFSVLSRLVVGGMIRRLGRRLTLALNVVMSALALIGMGFISATAVLAVLGAVVGFGLGLSQPITTAWVSDRAPEGQMGSALALRLAGNRLGQLAIPAAVGLLAGIAGTAMVFVASGLSLLGSAWWMRNAPLGPVTPTK